MRHLLLNLESPLMAFGGETIDNHGVIRPFPAASMLTGLLANALGWKRLEAEKHQMLQDRLVFAARIDRETPHRLSIQDFQTAQLAKHDMGWTTRGIPEGRAGGEGTYNSPHLRYRDYYPDMRVTVALRLDPESGEPVLDGLAEALQKPSRPLFIGRKPCLPSGALYVKTVEASSVLAALKNCPIESEEGWDDGSGVRVMWPDGERLKDGEWEDGTVKGKRIHMVTDQRNWVSGMHGGGRAVWEGTVGREWFETSERMG